MAEEIQKTTVDPEVQKWAPVFISIKTNLPLMKSVKEKAVTRLQQQHELVKTFAAAYDGAPNEECDKLVEAVTHTLTKAKEAYDWLEKKRTEITKPMDEAKAELMEYEKAVRTDKKTDNFYTAICRELASIQNKQISYKQEIERQAQKRKDVENYKVDLQAQMKKNLAALTIGYVKTTDTGSENFWKLATLENFAAKEAKFKGWTPALKVEDFQKAFQVQYDPSKLLFDDFSKQLSESKTPEDRKKVLDQRTAAAEAEFNALVLALKEEESYEKWSAIIVETITPTLNAWIGKIPQIKENLLALKNAADEEERKRLAAEQAAQAEADQKQRDEEFKALQEETNQAIDQEAQVSKTMNDFTAQATTQEIPDSGPTKKVYVMVDQQKVAKGIVTAIQKTIGHKEFVVFAKDKKGVTKVDDNGQPIFNEHIDYFLKFVAQHCPMELDGFELKEVAKLIIRK
jgi:hypothetical protein